MAAAKRGKTKYPGVFFRLQSRLDGLGEERQYYIIYRRAGEGRSGKLIEEPIGRESEGMSAAKGTAFAPFGLQAQKNQIPSAERRLKPLNLLKVAPSPFPGSGSCTMR